jgi:hypothetical protein
MSDAPQAKCIAISSAEPQLGKVYMEQFSQSRNFDDNGAPRISPSLG